MNPDDIKLSKLLRQSRLSPPLPPRFRENVWRRIEDAEAPVQAESWFAALAALVLHRRFAYATAAVLVLAGALLGMRDGMQTARLDAQARYVALVAPNALH